MSVTIDDLRQIASSVDNATSLLEPAVKKLLAQLPKGSRKAAFDVLVAEFPGLLAQFEDLGASVGMEMYDTMRAETSGLPAYKAIAVAKATPLVEAEQIGRACARFFLDPSLSNKQATDKAMRAVTDAVGLRTKHAMRQTVKNNAVRDPAKTSFARVPTGATTCAFCSMMASRGAVYASAKTAGAEDKYHHDCDCMIVPSWKGLKVNVKGYSDADHYANYHAARSSLEAEGVKYPKATQITARMREMFPGEYTDGHTGKPKGRPKDTGKPKVEPKPKAQKKARAGRAGGKPPKLPKSSATAQPNNKASLGNADEDKNYVDFRAKLPSDVKKAVAYANSDIPTARTPGAKHLTKNEIALTKSEYSALKAYSGHTYIPIQARLRETDGKIDGSGTHDALIRNIDKAMGKSKLDENVMLHRGTTLEEFTSMLGRAPSVQELTTAKDSTYVSHGYTSTSIGDPPAISSKPVIIHMKARAGHHAMNLMRVSRYGDTEREILLGRGTVFKIDQVEEHNGRIHVNVHIIEQANVY